MLRIGFANKFYTLWYIDTQPNYSQNDRGQITLNYTKVIYTYLQNLSIDEQNAKDKAKLKGCTDLEVDNELFGRNSSFQTVVKSYCDLYRNLSPFFEFGKYRDTKINECTDMNYLFWYYHDCSNRYAKSILLNNGYFESQTDINYLITLEQFNEYEERIKSKQLADAELEEIELSGSGHIVFTPSYNLNQYGGTEYKGIAIYFKDYKTLSYNGYNYSIPCVNGVGKKIKGKELVLLVRVIDYCDTKALEVISIKSIDGKLIESTQKKKINN